MKNKPNIPSRKQTKRIVTKPVQIRLAAHILDQVDALAYERGTDRTSVIKEAIADFLAKRKKQP